MPMILKPYFESLSLNRGEPVSLRRLNLVRLITEGRKLKTCPHQATD